MNKSFVRNLSGVLGALAASCFITGCGSTMNLAMDPQSPVIIDDSAVSRSMPKYSKIMLVPPSGTAPVAFEKSMAIAEREFIKRDLALISPAVTSRLLEGVQTKSVSDDSAKDLNNATGEVTKLSSVEKALIMAKRTNAEAILQIGNFEQLAGQAQLSAGGTRFFIKPAKGETMMEVDERSYFGVIGDDTKYRRSYGENVIDFSGRLIDVQSGQVMASFHYIAVGLRCARPYSETINDDGITINNRYRWSDDHESRMAKLYKELFSAIADQVNRGASAGGKSTAAEPAGKGTPPW